MMAKKDVANKDAISKRNTEFVVNTPDTQAALRGAPTAMNPSLDVSDVKVKNTSEGQDIARGYNHIQFGERPVSRFEVRDEINPWRPKGRK